MDETCYERRGKYFDLKTSSIGTPTLYLGSRVRKVNFNKYFLDDQDKF